MKLIRPRTFVLPLLTLISSFAIADEMVGENLIFPLELPQAKQSNQVAVNSELIFELPDVIWKPIGKARFSDDSTIDPETAWQRHSQTILTNNNTDSSQIESHLTEPESRTNRPTKASRWIAVDLESGVEYSVEIPQQLGRNLHTYLQQTGQTLGYAGKEQPTPQGNDHTSVDTGTYGWSKGQDSRTRRFNNKTYPYRTMGQLGGGPESGCSGTLIGPRHVLTAAHCLWNVEKKTWGSGRFRPGREGTCGSSSCQPYGSFKARWYFTPAEFREVENNWTYDYGIMVTYGRPGDTTGWMGYVTTSQSDLNRHCDKIPFGPGHLGGNCFNRGYPACGFIEAPNNCKQGWAYQDARPCEVGSFLWKASAGDGWKSNFTVNCDIGRGHSGSAVWSSKWQGNRKVIFGVASTQTCNTCNSGTSYPNRFRRVTPDVLDAISYFKTVQFP